MGPTIVNIENSIMTDIIKEGIFIKEDILIVESTVIIREGIIKVA